MTPPKEQTMDNPRHYAPKSIPDVIWDSQLDTALREVINRASCQCTSMELIDSVEALLEQLREESDD